MQLSKFPVISLILFTLIWRGESVVTLQSQDDSIVKVLVHILSSCYGDRLRGVGLAGNLPNTLGKTLSTKLLIPVVLIEDSPIHSERTLRPPIQFHQQLQVFVVEADSFDEFNNIIEKNIPRTIWWNHMASFFILDRSPKCTDVIDLLHSAWRNNVLNAKVICYDLFKGRRIILNFNPFTSQAPLPWNRVGIFTAQNNHPFAVFIRGYQGNKGMCVNLDFEKTKNLGGYEISVGEGFRFGNETIRSETNLHTYQYISTHDRIFHNIFCSLNATRKSRLILNLHQPVYADMRTIGRLMLYAWDFDKTTYPHTQTGFILISRFRGHKTQLEKILCVVDFNSRLGIGVVYFVTLIFLTCFVRQGLGPALLNLVRITCNTGFTHLSNGNAPRIFLTGLLFFVVTIQGIYQGNLAALLTTHIPRRNIDVMQDVVNLDYKVYANNYMTSIAKSYPGLEGRVIPIDPFGTDCWSHIKNEASVACLLTAQGQILDVVKELELHTSSEFITLIYSGYQIRWDWPLEERVNIILSRMVEADVIQPWDVKCKPLQLSDFKYDKEVQNNKDFKNIELAEVAFAFVILGIGLVCATIVFVIEVAIART